MHDNHDACCAHHPDRVAQLQGSRQYQSSARSNKKEQKVIVKQTSSNPAQSSVSEGARRL